MGYLRGTLLALAFGAVGYGQAAAAPSFGFAAESSNPGTITGIVAADFDGDGLQDLASSNFGGVAVRIQTAPGKYGPPVGSSAPLSLSGGQPTVGDFDADGRNDLIMRGNSLVVVWLSIGGGRFQPVASRFSGPIGGLAVGDFDGDGASDLAVTDVNTRSIAVRLGRRDGTFGQAVSYAVLSMQDVVAGDFNRDGRTDLATLARTSNETIGVAVLLGAGDGSFAPPLVSQPGSFVLTIPSLLVAADLNGDGNLDIAMQNDYSYRLDSCSVTVALGRGNGTMGTPEDYRCGKNLVSAVDGNGSSQGMVIADFTGDGLVDIAALFAYNQGFLHLYPGNADGTFQPAAVYNLGLERPSGIAGGDFTGDGRRDIAIASAFGLDVFSGKDAPFLRATLTRNGVPRSDDVGTTYTITVGNGVGAEPLSRPVTVRVNAGVYSNVTTISGPGWNCSDNCARTEPLAAGATYPPLTAKVVPTIPGPLVTVTAAVSGGGSAPLSLADVTNSLPRLSLREIHSIYLAGQNRDDKPSDPNIWPIAQNAWLEIKGANLVPANTPPAGVIWNSAPELAVGRLPTKLGEVSVLVNGKPAYIYYYCSAATSLACAEDQINVLTPLDSSLGAAVVVVQNLPLSSTTFPVALSVATPSLLRLGSSAFVTASHADYSLIGPTDLYTGLTTPARPGEDIIRWGVGFGAPQTPIVAGSAVQSGALPSTATCAVREKTVPAVVNLVSPGLYQINLKLPADMTTGYYPMICTYLGVATGKAFSQHLAVVQ
jgi:uncharacterized protein (TIGR03437 family)